MSHATYSLYIKFVPTKQVMTFPQGFSYINQFTFDSLGKSVNKLKPEYIKVFCSDAIVLLKYIYIFSFGFWILLNLWLFIRLVSLPRGLKGMLEW